MSTSLPISMYTHALIITLNGQTRTCIEFHAPTFNNVLDAEFAGKVARAYIKSLIPIYAKQGFIVDKSNFKLVTINQ